jgi:hypothetical protein
MNVEIGTDAAQFPEKEYINGIFLAVKCWSNIFLTYRHGLFSETGTACHPAYQYRGGGRLLSVCVSLWFNQTIYREMGG